MGADRRPIQGRHFLIRAHPGYPRLNSFRFIDFVRVLRRFAVEWFCSSATPRWVLNGHRTISLKNARALAAYFKMDVGAFV